MSWDEVRAMSDAGMNMGGHTRSHPILSNVRDRETLHNEISGSYSDLCEQTGKAPVAFSYPVGNSDVMTRTPDHVQEMVLQAGYKFSFSYTNAYARAPFPITKPIPRLTTEFGDDYAAFRWGMALASH
jgi:peptidoglycan/xylan/chitin deacetylase (PgdA/CDA1 family)